MGCGKIPDDVLFIGGPVVYNSVDEDQKEHNGLNNFWRSCENVKIINNQTDHDGTKTVGMTWAVSQAAPLRKVHIDGNLTLFDITHGDPNPMTSSGFASNCKIDGIMNPGSQQQLLIRNCDLQANVTKTSVWNMVYLGCNNPPIPTCPLHNTTPVPKKPQSFIGVNVHMTHKIREKPNLSFIDGKFKVLVYSTQNEVSGAKWEDPTTTLDVCTDF